MRSIMVDGLRISPVYDRSRCVCLNSNRHLSLEKRKRMVHWSVLYFMMCDEEIPKSNEPHALVSSHRLWCRAHTYIVCSQPSIEHSRCIFTTIVWRCLTDRHFMLRSGLFRRPSLVHIAALLMCLLRFCDITKRVHLCVCAWNMSVRHLCITQIVFPFNLLMWGNTKKGMLRLHDLRCALDCVQTVMIFPP